jgi:hypothetical protein
MVAPFAALVLDGCWDLGFGFWDWRGYPPLTNHAREWADLCEVVRRSRTKTAVAVAHE